MMRFLFVKIKHYFLRIACLPGEPFCHWFYRPNSEGKLPQKAHISKLRAASPFDRAKLVFTLRSFGRSREAYPRSHDGSRLPRTSGSANETYLIKPHHKYSLHAVHIFYRYFSRTPKTSAACHHLPSSSTSSINRMM